jgi:hypothetical protein
MLLADTQEKPRTSMAFHHLGWLITVFSVMPTGDWSLAQESTNMTYYVSPDGSDAWSGRSLKRAVDTQDGPFATLQRALEAVEQAKKSSRMSAFKIVVAGGEYRLQAPINIGPQHAGSPGAETSIEAAPGSQPIFSGGRPIASWHTLPDGRWETKIPDVQAGKWYFEQLWVNGRRAIRARTPNEGYHEMVSVTEKPLDGADAQNSRGRRKGQFEMTIEVQEPVASSLRELPRPFLKDVHLLAFHKWDNTRRRLDGVQADSPHLMSVGEAMKPWNPIVKGTPYRLENYAAALDAPGEWFLERNGTLLYQPLPGESLDSSRFVAPVLDQLVVVAGQPSEKKWVEHLRIRGLRFQYSQWLTPDAGFEPAQAAATIPAAIQIDGARSVVLEDCRFSQIGIYGVWFRRGCTDCRLDHCLIEDLGAGGVRIGETTIENQPELKTGRIAVHNNIIRAGGRIFPCAVGLWIGHSGENQVVHNDIGDFLYTGISVGWRWGYEHSPAKGNKIEFNRVHHIGQGVLSDMGGIYTLGPSEGTVVRNNVFHDIHSATYGGWGLYTDEGSTGILMENNLVYRTKSGGFHQHYGRDNIVRNNILVDATDQQLQATRVEDHRSFTFEHNIVVFDRGSLFNLNWAKVRSDKHRNCYWNSGGDRVDFGGMDLQQWQAKGNDAGSIVADPLFVDRQKDDYRLRADSPALALGFNPFDPTQAGVTGSDDWKRLAR